MAEESEYMTVPELAQELKMSMTTLAVWRMKKKGPDYIKMGAGRASKILYLKKSVEEFKNQKTVRHENESKL